MEEEKMIPERENSPAEAPAEEVKETVVQDGAPEEVAPEQETASEQAAPEEQASEEQASEAAAPEQEAAVEQKQEEASEKPAQEKTDEKGDKKKEKSKKRRIFDGILLGFQILIVLLSITICLIVILNPAEPDQVSPLGVKLLPVLSDSMEGSTVIDGKKYEGFPTGSLVIATNPENGGKNLKVGDIVTFVDRDANGTKFLNTHRIVRVNRETLSDGSVYITYQTKGDNKPAADSVWKTPSDIKAVYTGHIKGLGSAIHWIRDGYHFIFVVIIPLALLMIYNIYLVAQIVLESKMRKAKALAAEKAKEAALASIDEEEIKRKAIEEYLRAQAAAQATGEAESKGDSE